MRHVKVIVALVLAISLVATFAACDDATAPVKLTAPALTADGATVSWAGVEGATAYDVYVNGVSVGEQSETSYSLEGKSAGAYEVTVIAKADEGYTDSDAGKSVTVEIRQTLSAPVISISGNTVSWQAVANASGYEVFVNSASVGVQEGCVYGIAVNEPGTYKIAVKAKGNGYYDDSALSAEVSYTVEESVPEVKTLDAPVITLEGETISWQAVENATLYKVFVNGAEIEQTESTSFVVTARTEGTYSYTVVASNPSSNYVDSAASNAVEYVVGAYDMTLPTLASTVSGGTEYLFEIGADGVLRYVPRAGVTDYTKYIWYFEKDGDTGLYNIKLYNGLYLGWCGNGNQDDGGNELVQSIKTGAADQQWYVEETENGYKIYNKAHSDAWSGGNWQYYIGIKENAFKFGDNCSLIVAENKDLPFEQKPAIAAPVLEADGTLLSWNAVENAGSYIVFVDGAIRATVQATEYDLGEVADGKHTAYVIAVPDDLDSYFVSGISNVVDVEVASLDFAEPILAIHRTNGGQDLVAGVDGEGYIVPADSATVDDLAPYMWYLEKADDNFYYIKLASGKYMTATVFSNSQKCAQALDFTGEDDQKWGFVAQTDAGRYKIVNAAEPTQTSYFGEYYNNFAFDAVCNAWDLENKDIPYQEKQTLDAPVVTIADKTVSWQAVENATAYKVYVNDSLVSTQSELSYTISAEEQIVYKVYVKASADGYYDSVASNTVSFDNIDLFANKVYAYYNDANQTLGQVDENGDLLIGPSYSSVDDYSEYLWTVEKITEGAGEGYYTIRFEDGRYLTYADQKDGMGAHASALAYSEGDSKQWWILVADESTPDSFKLESVYYKNYYSDVYLGEWYSSENGNAYVYNGGCKSWTFVATDVAIDG